MSGRIVHIRRGCRHDSKRTPGKSNLNALQGCGMAATSPSDPKSVKRSVLPGRHLWAVPAQSQGHSRGPGQPSRSPGDTKVSAMRAVGVPWVRGLFLLLDTCDWGRGVLVGRICRPAGEPTCQARLDIKALRGSGPSVSVGRICRPASRGLLLSTATSGKCCGAQGVASCWARSAKPARDLTCQARVNMKKLAAWCSRGATCGAQGPVSRWVGSAGQQVEGFCQALLRQESAVVLRVWHLVGQDLQSQQKISHVRHESHEEAGSMVLEGRDLDGKDLQVSHKRAHVQGQHHRREVAL